MSHELKTNSLLEISVTGEVLKAAYLAEFQRCKRHTLGLTKGSD